MSAPSTLSLCVRRASRVDTTGERWFCCIRNIWGGAQNDDDVAVTWYTVVSQLSHTRTRKLSRSHTVQMISRIHTYTPTHAGVPNYDIRVCRLCWGWRWVRWWLSGGKALVRTLRFWLEITRGRMTVKNICRHVCGDAVRVPNDVILETPTKRCGWR